MTHIAFPCDTHTHNIYMYSERKGEAVSCTPHCNIKVFHNHCCTGPDLPNGHWS